VKQGGWALLLTLESQLFQQRPVRSVEVGGLLGVEAAGGNHPFPMAAEDALDEISVAQVVPEPSLLRHWKTWPQPNEYPGKNAGPILLRLFVLPEDLDPLNTAARRGLLEDKAVETGFTELFDFVSGIALHSLGQNLAGNGLDQLWFGITTLELDCRSRYTEADLEFGTHRNPFEPLAEDIGEIPVVLVAAVVAHLGAKQAR